MTYKLIAINICLLLYATEFWSTILHSILVAKADHCGSMYDEELI